jgi:hypothetical protein
MWERPQTIDRTPQGVENPTKPGVARVQGKRPCKLGPRTDCEPIQSMPAHGEGHAAADAHDLRLYQFARHPTDVDATSDSRGRMKTRHLKARTLNAANPSKPHYIIEFSR